MNPNNMSTQQLKAYLDRRDGKIPSAKDLAHQIRDQVQSLNDLLLLSALAEVDVEFVVTHNRDAGEPTSLRVYIKQEV